MNWSPAVLYAGSWNDVKNICGPAWIVLGPVVYMPGRGDNALQVLTDVCVSRLALLLGMHKAWQLSVLHLSYCVLWELHQ